MVTIKQAEKYHRNKSKTKKVILKNVKKKKHVVYGARALNVFLPSFLDKETQDYDIFSKTPRATAKRVEKKLDKEYGGDFFRVEKAIHPGTYRVKSNITGKEVADYTKREKGVEHTTVRNVNYVTLDWQKKKAKRILKDPEAKFRHQKDKDTLQRIKIHEELKKKGGK